MTARKTPRRAQDASPQVELEFDAPVRAQDDELRNRVGPEATRPAEAADGAAAASLDSAAPGEGLAPELPSDPAGWLAHAFGERVAAWSVRSGVPGSASEWLRVAAEAVSAATAAGHACVFLSELGGDEADATRARHALLASGIVGPARTDVASPLVLDDDGRLYLRRYFEYERRIAKRLARCTSRSIDDAARKLLAARLAELFAGNEAALAGNADWQKIAAALAVTNDLTVISGGPGTGKTTTVVNLLACLIALEPNCRIALAAPTGKAAARMQDALRQRARHLPPAVQERLPPESFTIHRLLGVIPDSHEFRHHARNPLALDVLVVDEASMLDLALAARLFDAVPPAARIILLGDKDQLAAVESGAVFSELCADPTLSPACIERLSATCAIPADRFATPAPASPTPLHDRVVWFRRNFRFAAESGIGRLAREINAGDAEAAIGYLRTQEDASLRWLDDAEPAFAPESLAHLRAGYARYIETLRSDARDADAVFDAFERYRILCAERASRRGVEEVNAVIDRDCRRAIEDAWPSAPRSPWHCGRPVMILRNDYVLKLHNGDVGIALPDAAGNLLVHFRQTDGTFRTIAPLRLPAHETAFATTVHKAQGSEFDEIALVLPAKASRVATRELIYTAVTRARNRVTLVCGREGLEAAIRTPTVRHSGLIARIEEASR